MKKCRAIPCLALLTLLVLPAGAMELEHQATRDLVDFVTRAADLVAKEGAGSCDAFKKEGGEWLAGER